MQIRSLNNVKFSELVAVFLKAFDGYFVKMPTEVDYYRNRWDMAKVDYDLSFGMFNGDTLVGFIINAVDHRNGHRIAHNTGTGVLPDYRGKQIVDAIYDHAMPILRKRGVEKCTLEVITKNKVALKVYERIGFTVVKDFKCYDGDINTQLGRADFMMKKVGMDFFDWREINQNVYSWDNNIETLKQGNFEFYVVFNGEVLAAYFIINPQTNYLAQFDVFENNSRNWERLF
ncbi:MAG: GNAT family N-acetyltransferase, partial [Bacteroidota bacterium]